MRIDLDEIVGKLPSWSLTVTLNGKQLAIRQPTEDEAKQLASIGGMTYADAAKVVAPLFEDSNVDPATWSHDQLTALLSYLAGFYVKFKSDRAEAVVKLARETVAAQMGPQAA